MRAGCSHASSIWRVPAPFFDGAFVNRRPCRTADRLDLHETSHSSTRRPRDVAAAHLDEPGAQFVKLTIKLDYSHRGVRSQRALVLRCGMTSSRARHGPEALPPTPAALSPQAGPTSPDPRAATTLRLVLSRALRRPSS